MTQHQQEKALGLLVPITVEAFCLSEEDAKAFKFVEQTHDFKKLPRPGQGNPPPYLGESVTTRPFDATERSPGVYVHWALPDALMKGRQTENGDIAFKPLPNLWLVTRTTTRHGDDGKVISKSKRWIVESDFLSDESQHSYSVSVPVKTNAQQRQSYSYLGRVLLYEDWEKGAFTDGRYYENLTAIGYGESSFAGFFPNSCNVFGLYDDLKESEIADDEQVTLFYTVCGRYRDPSRDPVLQYNSTQAAFDDLQWELPEADPLPNITYTLCHGTVAHVRQKKESRYSMPPQPDKIAVGNSSIEALSALIASVNTDQESRLNTEQLLNALQLGLLTKSDQFDENMLNEALHQNSFRATAALQRWEIKPQKSADEETSRKKTPSPSKALLRELDELNRLQVKLDQAQYETLSRRWQLFADWYRYQLLLYSSREGWSDELLNSLKAYLNEVTDNIKEISSDNLEKQRKKVEHLLGNDFLLTKLSGARYWSPKDPVMLIMGKVAQPSLRFGGDGRYTESGRLSCRLSDEIITRVRYRDNTDAILALDANTIAPLQHQEESLQAQTMHQLAQEAMLLDPFQAWFRIASPQKSATPSLDDHPLLAALVQSLQTANVSDGALELDGSLPSPVAYTVWSPKWGAVRAEWQCHFYPVKKIQTVGETYDKDWIKEDFLLDNFGLAYQKETVADGAQIYTGSNELSDSSTIALKDHIDKLLKLDPPQNLKKALIKVKSRFGDAPIQSLSLEGLHEALLMKQHSLQMDIQDPNSRRADWNKLKNVVGDANTHGVLPNNLYNAVRTGLVSIDKFGIVESIGLLKKVESNKIICSASLKPPATLKPRNNQFFLPPRLSQPAQLRFRWQDRVSAVEAFSRPNRSPIIGWIMPNRLDNSLAVYDHEGVALGALVVSGEQTLWRDAPRLPSPTHGLAMSEAIEEALKNADPAFRKIILRIYDEGKATFLKKLLQIIDNVTAKADPDYQREAAEEAVLIGRPLVFARVSLGLQVQGLPALNQSWPVFKQTIEKYQEDEDICYKTRPTNNFPDVRFPVRLGNLKRRDDGLVGYFTDDEFETFYSSALGLSSDDTEGFLNPDGDEPITLAISDESPLEAFLLFDPRFSVHAISGIQPVKAIDIPAELYEHVLQQLQITFLTSPIITNAPTVDARVGYPLPEELSLPLPGTKQGQWSWIELTDAGYREITETTERQPLNDDDKPAEPTAFTTIHKVDDKENRSIHPLAIREGWLRFKR